MQKFDKIHEREKRKERFKMQNFILITFVILILVFGFNRGIKVFVAGAITCLMIIVTIKLLPILILIAVLGYFYLRKKVKIYRNFDFRGFENNYNRGYNGSYNGYEGFGGFENLNNTGRMKEYYSELEVEESATDEELKKSHKRLVRMYHPDMHHDKTEHERKAYEEKFKKINEAYENIKKSRGI